MFLPWTRIPWQEAMPRTGVKRAGGWGGGTVSVGVSVGWGGVWPGTGTGTTSIIRLCLEILPES